MFGRLLNRSKATLSTERLDLTAEAQNMDIALRAAEKIMNDDIKGAEEALKTGDSAFHKLAKGTLGFMKASLGFEQDVMKEASDSLYEAESSAYTYYYKAQHDKSAFQSNIYDKGAEFLLCQAEAQIMSAIVGVLNESLTESLKGFYKMRKAYMTLESLMAMEQRYMKTRGVQSLPTSRMASKESLRSVESSGSALPVVVEPPGPGQSQSVKQSGLRKEMTPGDLDSDDDDDFFDTNEGHSQGYTSKQYEGNLERPTRQTASGNSLDDNIKHLDMSDRMTKESLTPSQAGSRPPLSRTNTGGSKFGIIEIAADDEVFQNSLDVFIHSGTNLMFGIISLMISVIPPAFARVLSIIGFRGNREKGIRMLWQASKFHNVNGGMAALVIFGWYNGLIGFCDIYSDPDPDLPLMEQVEGYPADRLKALLSEMRGRYPESHLWMIEQARMAAAGRNCDDAIELLSQAGKSDMKQLQALQVFEKSLDAQNAHRYELCASSFLECIDLNGWSQALYYFIAGGAYLQKARDLAAAGDVSGAAKFDQLAETQFKKAPSCVGKKKMMGRQLPFDQFVQRKINKWTEQSQAWGCSFLDAIGTSPIEESIFLWNGYKKMNESQLLKSLKNIELSESRPNWKRQGRDEMTVATLLKATILRNLRRHKESQALLEKNVFVHDKAAFSGHNMDTWAAPAAYYEHAVNSWQQRHEYITRFGTTLAGPSADQAIIPTADINADRANVASARKYVEIAKNWGSYELDARIGMKVTAALGAIAKWEKRNGVA